MATIEYINQRIEGKQKEIKKLEGKLARIEKAQASGWQNNPYYYNENDLKWTNKDLTAAREALAKWEAELVTATEKANSRNVKAILDFLEGWKARVTEYYRKGLVEYYETRKVLRQMYSEMNAKHYGTPEYKEAEAAYRAAEETFRGKVHGYYHEEKYQNKFGRICSKNVKDRDGELEYCSEYQGFKNLDEALAKLAKDLEQDANAKYDDIIERTNYVVGTITDASLLRVGAKGELNGFVIGDKGIAKVETIGAGGYNIQCFHFRTLIHAVKEVYNF